MRSVRTAAYRAAYESLPASVREAADRAFAVWSADPEHPSLHFKRSATRAGNIWSARVGLGYRALARIEEDAAVWFWVGSHAEYDRLLTRL